MDDLHYALDWLQGLRLGRLVPMLLAQPIGSEKWDIPETQTGRQWLERAAFHLDRRINEYLRAGDPPYSPDRQALAIVTGVAKELGKAADALEHCAHYLKEKTGSPYEASKAHVAATRAREAQQSLVVERTQTDWPMAERRAG